MKPYAAALNCAADQESAVLQALSSLLEAASAYARIAAMTDIAETAQHNYRNAQLAHAVVQAGLSSATAVPARFVAQFSKIGAQLEVLESQFA